MANEYHFCELQNILKGFNTWSIRSSVKSTLKQGFEYTQMIRCSLGEKFRHQFGTNTAIKVRK